MLRFDVHQHFLPPPVLEVLRARREPPRLSGSMLELREGSFPFDARLHDLGERLAVLDRDRIDVAVVSLPPTLETEAHPELRDAYHAGIRETVRAADGRLRAFAAGECLPGFAGACVSAGTLVAGLGELEGELARAGQILFVHPGPPGPPPAGAPPWWCSVVDYTAQMQAAFFHRLAAARAGDGDPRVVFGILAGGAPIQLERLRAQGRSGATQLPEGVHLDTATYGAHALEHCVQVCGAHRLVYGSDVPVVDSRPTLQALASLGEPLLETVSSANPTRLLP
ncbi:MAG TPA: amidohydrolase family protein [Gaiellaceae bacterium]|nr:amidohydrolase family protein [Gaiellaceae bacterium]